MKKEQLLATVAENGREVKFIALWSTDETPLIIGLRVEYHGQLLVKSKIDLSDYADKLKALQPEEVFTIGCNPDCDLCTGYSGYFKWCDENSVNDDEYYISQLRTISRIHAFVEREGDTFRLYDCSYAGTVIVSQKKPWWKRIFR